MTLEGWWRSTQPREQHQAVKACIKREALVNTVKPASCFELPAFVLPAGNIQMTRAMNILCGARWWLMILSFEHIPAAASVYLSVYPSIYFVYSIFQVSSQVCTYLCCRYCRVWKSCNIYLLLCCGYCCVSATTQLRRANAITAVFGSDRHLFIPYLFVYAPFLRA